MYQRTREGWWHRGKNKGVATTLAAVTFYGSAWSSRQQQRRLPVVDMRWWTMSPIGAAAVLSVDEGVWLIISCFLLIRLEGASVVSSSSTGNSSLGIIQAVRERWTKQLQSSHSEKYTEGGLIFFYWLTAHRQRSKLIIFLLLYICVGLYNRNTLVIIGFKQDVYKDIFVYRKKA